MKSLRSPVAVRVMVRVFCVLCVLLVLADFARLQSALHPLEAFFGFHALFGFAACVILALVARWLRPMFMRGEDYYERDD